MAGSQYTVIIKASLDSTGLKTGAQQAGSAFDQIAQQGERAAKRQIDAFQRMNQAIEAGRQEFVRSQIAAAEQGASGVVNASVRAAQQSQRVEQSRVKAFQQSINQIDKAEQSRVTTTQKVEADRLKAFQASINQIDKAEQASIKTRNKQTQDAMRDIARIEKDRARIMADVEKTITAQAKSENQQRVREFRRSMNEMVASLRATSAAVSTGVGGGLAATGALASRLPALLGVAVAGFTFKGLIADTALYKARTDALVVSLGQLARVNNLNQTEVEAAVNSLRKANIAQQEALQITSQFLAVGLDLKHLNPLAEVAKNVAVIGNTNSSDAFQRLVDAIQVGNPVMLRTLGIFVNMEKVMDEYAKSVGKTTAELTENEKQTVRINAVIEAGAKFAGVYDAAMGSLAKRIGSMDRVVKDIANSLGAVFQPALETIVTATERALKDVSAKLQDGKPTLENSMRVLAEGMGQVFGEAIASAGQSAGERMVNSFIEGLKSFSAADILKASPLVSLPSLLERFQPLQVGAARGLYNAARQAFGLQDVASDAIPAQRAALTPVPLPATQNLAAESLKVAEAQKKAFEIARDLTAQLSSFGDVSLVAATKQKLLAAGIEDLTTGYAAFALALARANDEARVQQEFQKLETDRITARNRALYGQLESLADSARLQVLELAAAERGGLTEIEKFNLGLGAQATGIAELGDRLEVTRKAVQAFSDAVEQAKVDKAAKELLDVRKAIRESIGDVVGGVTRELSGRPLSQLEDVVRSLERVKGLKLERGAFDPLIKLIQESPSEAGKALEAIQGVLSSVRGDLGPSFDAVSQMILNAASAADALDKKLAAAASPLAREVRALHEELTMAQDEIAIVSETSALRYQVAWQRAYNDVVLADQYAREAQIASQMRIADAEVFHADQARAIVLEHLSRTRSQTEIFADAIIDVYEGINDVVFQGVQKITGGIKILDNLIAGLISRLANRLFQKLLDVLIPPTGGQRSGGLFGGGGTGGGFSLGNIFGGGTGGFAGGPGAGGILNRLFGGGGGAGTSAGILPGSSISLAGILGALPTSSITAPVSLSGAAASQGALGQILAQATRKQGGGMLSGITSSLGAAGGLPLLAATTSITTLIAAFRGQVSGVQALLGGGILSFLIGGAAVRRREEQQRDDLKEEAYAQLTQLLELAKRGQLDPATAGIQAQSIVDQYYQQVSQFRTASVRRSAENFRPYFNSQVQKIVEAAKGAVRRQEIASKIIPEFAMGGLVPFRSNAMTLIKVRPQEKLFYPSGLSASVPGIDRGVDSVYTYAPPGTAVVPPNVQGYANGGVVGAPGEIHVHVELSANVDLEDVFIRGAKTTGGHKVIVHTTRKAAKNGELS